MLAGMPGPSNLSKKQPHHPSLKSLGIAVEYFPGYVNLTSSLHSLDVVLLSFIVRGRGRHIIDGETFAESGASLAVTHYGQQHSILTDRKGMDVINVYLDLQNHPLPTLPRELRMVLPLLLPLHPRFQHRLNRIVRLQFSDPGPLADLLFAIAGELERREIGYEEAVMIQFRLFLMLCCRHALKNGFLVDAPNAGHTQPRLEELRQYLDHAYAEPHKLGSLAQRVGFRRTSLCRAFKTYTGKRVFDYLIERRIQAAMVSLRSSDEKILTVALNSGFNDLAYFNRKFKQLVGMTPSQHRRMTPVKVRPKRAARRKKSKSIRR
ncbi:MAG: AraC family transcriptional regulator [Verrucomicrobia bacterium]|nr:AraC family transcriptional regulator [Verrucomicrobiota bacterium]